MAPKEKQAELAKHRDILLATIDYHIEKTAGSMVYDQVDPLTDLYQQLKQQTEKYYLSRRLDRIKQRLHAMTRMPLLNSDLSFNGFIKEKTGHDIDIFESLHSRVDKIIDQKEIKNEDEHHDAMAMANLSRQTPVYKEKIDALTTLLVDFANKKKSPGKNYFFTRHLLEIYSPDNKRRIIISEDGSGKNAMTSVNIYFEAASGVIYAANGINLNTRTYWWNNNTIIIETKKGITSVTKCNQVQSFEDIVSIKYIEN